MGEPEYSEEKLVKRCQKGDEGAFRILVEKYKDLSFWHGDWTGVIKIIFKNLKEINIK